MLTSSGMLPAALCSAAKLMDPGHVLQVVAFDEKEEAVGTGRLLANGKIGRMAVLKDWRGMGVGGEMLRRLMEASLELNLSRLFLSSQIDARSFYEKAGFEAIGGPFVEAGIVHIEMQRVFNLN